MSTACRASTPQAPTSRASRSSPGRSCCLKTSAGCATRCEIGNVGLIIIDPIGNHLGGVDTDKEGLVRHAIGGLNDLANELGNTIIGVRHLTKNTSAGALASVLGSTAWRDIPAP